MCEFYGVTALTEPFYQNWFTKFRSGKSSLKDNQRRPSKVNDVFFFFISVKPGKLPMLPKRFVNFMVL